MGLSSRLITYDVWGENSPPAYSFSFRGTDAFERAQRPAGAVRGFVALNSSGSAGSEGEALALCHAFRTVYSNADNTLAAWIGEQSPDDFAQVFAPYAAGSYGIQFERSEYDAIGQLKSNTFQIGENAPWCLRFCLYKPPEGAAYPTAKWTRHKWDVVISKSKCELKHRAATWSQANEDDWFDILGQETIDAEDQETADVLEATLYDVSKSIEIKGELYGQWHELVFIPEPRGIININADNSDTWQAVKVDSILATRRNGVVWKAGPIRVRSNGIAMIFQVGKPQFVTTAQLRLGKYQTATAGDWTYTLLKDTSLSGTVISMTNVEINSVFDEVVVNSSTSNTAHTPFFYAGHAVRANGVRSGYGSSVTFDTDDFEQNPVEEISPTHEAIGRRYSAQVRMRNINGGTTNELTAPTPFHYPAGQHLMCDLWIGGVRVVKNGLIAKAGHEDVGQVTDNLTTAEVMRSNTKTFMVICDQWARMDEIILEDVLPVGDGLRLGALFRLCFALAGLNSGEYTGVGSTEGRILPSAVPGENWRVQPAKGTSLGDFLRHCISIYGMGLQLWIDTNGVWQLGNRSTATRFEIEVGATVGRAFEGLAITHDPCDQFNAFRVEGGIGPDGRPLIANWIVWESILPSGGPGSLKFIGRSKRFPTVRDESLVTQSDCDFAVRSLAKLHSKPGQQYPVEVTYRPDVFPGDFFTLHGRNVEVRRLSGGDTSWGEANDSGYAGKMSILAGEVE